MATEEDDLCGRLDFHSTTASLYDPFFDLTIFHTAKLTGKIKIYLRTDLPVWFIVTKRFLHCFLIAETRTLARFLFRPTPPRARI